MTSRDENNTEIFYIAFKFNRLKKQWVCLYSEFFLQESMTLMGTRNVLYIAEIMVLLLCAEF